MEENKNIELDEIMTREMDIFNSSWSILNNNCKVLEQYSEFIQKYLDTINTYYMSLTELNATFPSLLSDFTNIEFETIIKKYRSNPYIINPNPIKSFINIFKSITIFDTFIKSINNSI